MSGRDVWHIMCHEDLERGMNFTFFYFCNKSTFLLLLLLLTPIKPVDEPDTTRYFSLGCLKWCPPLIPQLSISILSISMRNKESPCHISTIAFINDGWVKNCWETEKLFGKYGLILFANKLFLKQIFVFLILPRPSWCQVPEKRNINVDLCDNLRIEF